MRCLVTGGLGFVGSNLVDYLVDELGYEVVVIDNLSSDSSSRLYMKNGVEYWVDDIRNLGHSKYSGQKFDVVFHLAALARIQPSFKDPSKYLSVDMMGTAEVCEYARLSGSKLVYAGSSSAYAGQMLNPYAFAKYTGEQICEMYHKVYGMSTVTARFFNVYGNRQPTTGPYATVIGIFQEQSSRGESLTVTGTGEQRRDFTNVKDIVRGICSLSSLNGKGQVLNLGTGKNYSINQVAEMFGGPIKYIPPRPGEAWTSLADISETTETTNWNPTVSLHDYVRDWKIKNSIIRN